MAYDVPLAVSASWPAPGTTAITLDGAHPAVSRYVTVKRIVVAGVPLRGDAFGAVSRISCDAPLQLAALAVDAHGEPGQMAGRASVATRSPMTPLAITRANTPLACTCGDPRLPRR